MVTRLCINYSTLVKNVPVPVGTDYRVLILVKESGGEGEGIQSRGHVVEKGEGKDEDMRSRG